MRLSVIGTKEFHDFKLLKSTLDKIDGITAIVSGAALGTDKMAARYAKENNIKLIEFPPDYEKHGEEAKHFRDRQIVENCDQLIAFWDGKCEGTKYTLDYAKEMGISVEIVDVYNKKSHAEFIEACRKHGFSNLTLQQAQGDSVKSFHLFLNRRRHG